MTRKQQLRIFADNQAEMMAQQKTGQERDYQLMLWAGFLTGLRLTNAITASEYNAYYEELREIAEKTGAA